MERITSKDNKRIKQIAKLIASSSRRREEGAFVCEGQRLCDDALHSSCTVLTAVFSDTFMDKHGAFVDRAAAAVQIAISVPDSIFCALSDTKTPQGVLFVLKTLDKSPDFDTIKQNGKVFALESIQDPTNLGTILRTAEALGLDAVVLSADCCDVYAPKVLRGSMGAVFRLPLIIADDLAEWIRGFNRCGVSFAAVLDRDSVSLRDADLTAPVLAAVGNEGNGLSDRVIEACSHKLFIPMAGDAESLNASVAASVIMWEMIK